MSPAQLIVGLDVGTTSAKAVAFDARGAVHGAGDRGYALREPAPGDAEQDAHEVIDAALAATAAAVAQAGSDRVAAISLSTAMHALIGLDGAGDPITPVLTWADNRAVAQARRLRAEHGDLHARTGTPPHPMAPLAKLMWFAEREPDLHARAARWVGLKELLVRRLTGEWVVDASCASGTGLMESARGDWDERALAVASIRREQLCPIVATTQRLALRETGIGLAAGTPVVVGAGDGPLANLGLGAVAPGMAACSIGTSGALRTLVPAPGIDPAGHLFCYALVPGRWALGGAVSNGGSVLPWLGHALAPELTQPSADALLAAAAEVPAGSDGLVMLPYLLSERAPHWDALASGAYVGLRHHHRRGHLVRAAIEGVCQQLALVLASVTDAGHDVSELRATGGFARSAWWRQLLSDVLGIEVGYADDAQGSALGAALIGFLALGQIDSLDRSAQLVTVTRRHRPDPAAAALYAEQRPVFAQLYDALVPSYTALDRIARGRP